MGSSSFVPALWFLAILALIPFALWLLKRSPLQGLNTQGGVRVVGSTFLGPNQRLITVALGEGETRRHLLLGVTAQNIQFLQELQPGEAPAAVAAPAPSFAALLARARRPKP